jgi:hypothetical protein
MKLLIMQFSPTSCPSLSITCAIFTGFSLVLVQILESFSINLKKLHGRENNPRPEDRFKCLCQPTDDKANQKTVRVKISRRTVPMLMEVFI